MKFRYGLGSVQILHAIPLCFSQLLRNSLRPWVRHACRPVLPDSLGKLIRRHNLQCRFSRPRISYSLQPSRLVNARGYPAHLSMKGK
jgi:hypothetical protein